MITIACLECGLPADILARFSLWSTDGPVEHLKMRCSAGHALTPLVEDLAPSVRRLLREPEGAAGETVRFTRVA